MRSIATLFSLLLCCPATCLAQMPLPNASFEQGTDRPTGWKLVGKGEWAPNGFDGARCISVTGNGQDNSYWQSDPLPLKPNAVYQLTFRARSQSASGGTATSGPPFANRDLGRISESWRTFDSIFVTPSNLRPESAVLRFGQWTVKGTIQFDQVQVAPAIPVYARDGNLVLGDGESVVRSTYTFDAPFDGVSRNHSRPLFSFNATFNSNRWVFGRDSALVYRHRIPSRRQRSAELSVAVVYHTSGQLLVEGSRDGQRWVQLGTIDKLSGLNLRLPDSLFPSDAIFVRMRTAGDANLQVGSYSYSATLDGTGPDLLGRTHLVSILKEDPRLAITFDEIGQGESMDPLRIVVRAKNRTGSLIRIRPELAMESAEAGGGTDSEALHEIAAGAEQVIPLAIAAGSAGQYALTLRLGEGSPFEARASIRIADLHATAYGALLPGSSDDVAIWWCNSGWKINRSRPAPTARSQALYISAARNEAEAAQLVIRPARALAGFAVSTQNLTGPNNSSIPAENIEILRERYLLVTHPTDYTSVAGSWPDPLPPFTSPINLEPGKNQFLWVRVKVPKNASPGVYTGQITLRAEGYEKSVPIRVRVFNFALPDRMTCQTAFGFSPQNVWRYQKVDSREERRAVLEKYWASFAAHHISPYDPAPMDPIAVSWPDKESFIPELDFSAWDQAMHKAIDIHHFNSFRLHIPGMGGGTFHARSEPELLGFKEDTPQYKKAFSNYCRALESHLKEKGWLDEAYVYWFDEPDPKDYDFVMNGFRKLKEAAPGINRMLTEQVEPKLIGGPNIWCPVSPEYKHEPAEQRRSAGEKFWWYVCTGPKAPYCTLFIDHPATELRVWLWQTWQRKIDGILVWQSNYWTSPTAYPKRNQPQNPYEDPMGWVSGYSTPEGVKRAWGNGDGRFIYPPEAAADGNPSHPVLEGPVDSIRWEMLRDGIEDYEYHVILKKLLAEKAQRISESKRAEFEALLNVPAEITRDMTTFTRDPRPIEEQRIRLARAIDQLSGL